MKATFVSLIFAASALAQSFTINTPTNAVVCQPLLLSWSGGTPPYFLSILPGNQPSAPALVDLGKQDGTSFTWTVNQPQGTSLGLTLRDSNGQVAQSAPFNVNGGGDTSCIGQNPSSSGAAGGSAPPATGATTGASTPATAGTTTPAGTTPATSAPAGSAPATTRPATSTSSRATTSGASGAASSSTNAAPGNMVQVGAAGVVGAALAALLV